MYVNTCISSQKNKIGSSKRINKIISKLGLNNIYDDEKYANFFLFSGNVFTSMNIKEFLNFI